MNFSFSAIKQFNRNLVDKRLYKLELYNLGGIFIRTPIFFLDIGIRPEYDRAVIQEVFAFGLLMKPFRYNGGELIQFQFSVEYIFREVSERELENRGRHNEYLS